MIAGIDAIWLPICILNAAEMLSYFGGFARLGTDITNVWAILDTSPSYGVKKVMLKIAVTKFRPRGSRH